MPGGGQCHRLQTLTGDGAELRGLRSEECAWENLRRVVRVACIVRKLQLATLATLATREGVTRRKFRAHET